MILCKQRDISKVFVKPRYCTIGGRDLDELHIRHLVRVSRCYSNEMVVLYCYRNLCGCQIIQLVVSQWLIFYYHHISHRLVDDKKKLSTLKIKNNEG